MMITQQVSVMFTLGLGAACWLVLAVAGLLLHVVAVAAIGWCWLAVAVAVAVGVAVVAFAGAGACWLLLL
eukprot:6461762-Amphidinium_carterae.5